ncbi:MAG TPA: M23 family metallopeptidase [Nakamurella sp.]
MYAHLSQRLVPAGTHVQAGQQIGKAGHEGNVIPAGPGGAHLHFEVKVDNSPVNPVPYLRQHGAL